MSDRLAREATLLDLEMREHLALREEMYDLRRQGVTLVTSALVAAGGASAVVGAGAFGTLDGPRGLLLLSIAALTIVASLATVGLYNASMITQLQINRTAADIRSIALPDGDESEAAFLKYQVQVRWFVERVGKLESKGVVAAWLASYGAFVVLGALVYGLSLVLTAVGGWLVLFESHDWTLPGGLLFGLDLLLGIVLGFMLLFTTVPEERWRAYFYGLERGSERPQEGSGAPLVAPDASPKDAHSGE